MWLSLVEEANKMWFALETLTLLYPYKTIQGRIVKALAPYVDIIKRYSETAKRPVRPLTEKYLEEEPKVAEQNVALLKNAIELWRTATKTSDAIAPILSHYSWHCFNSFLVYSFFQWVPQHSKSHGVNIRLSDDLTGIRIQILKSGLFQRLVDTWTLIGASLAFSRFLPIVKNDTIHFIPNNRYLPSKSDELSLGQLMKFSPIEFEKELKPDQRDHMVVCPFIANSVNLPNAFLQSYLVLFVASSIARYRPTLWHSILSGESKVQSDFALDSSGAVQNYTLGRREGLGLVSQVTRILRIVEEGKFIHRKRGGGRIEFKG
jgi:hypothetical protein